MGHPDVADVQVVGVPDARYGEELVAFVVPRGGAEPDAEGIAAFSARHGRTYRLLLLGQRALPRVPPRALTLVFRVLSRPRLVDRAFTWYLEQAHPRLADATPSRPRGARAPRSPARAA